MLALPFNPCYSVPEESQRVSTWFLIQDIGLLCLCRHVLDLHMHTILPACSHCYDSDTWCALWQFILKHPYTNRAALAVYWVRGLSFNQVSGWGRLQSHSSCCSVHRWHSNSISFQQSKPNSLHPPARPRDQITRLPICGCPSRAAVRAGASNSIVWGVRLPTKHRNVCVCGVRGID